MIAIRAQKKDILRLICGFEPFFGGGKSGPGLLTFYRGIQVGEVAFAGARGRCRIIR
jgi:hypothetical protein